MVTYTSEYQVKDTCLAIALFDGKMIFVDTVEFSAMADFCYFTPRGTEDWQKLPTKDVERITVGISPLGACQG